MPILTRELPLARMIGSYYGRDFLDRYKVILIVFIPDVSAKGYATDPMQHFCPHNREAALIVFRVYLALETISMGLENRVYIALVLLRNLDFSLTFCATMSEGASSGL